MRRRYAEYRHRQARALVGMMPREAIRPLYRRALRTGVQPSATDPLRVLVQFCEALLPLPPFDRWLEDLETHPEAYLDDLDATGDVPTATAPTTLEARLLGRSTGAWTARLRGFHDPDTWRGFIAFEEVGSGRVHRTSLIFREPGPRALRDRFLSFEPATLEAFLRSTLP